MDGQDFRRIGFQRGRRVGPGAMPGPAHERGATARALAHRIPGRGTVCERIGQRRARHIDRNHASRSRQDPRRVTAGGALLRARHSWAASVAPDLRRCHGTMCGIAGIVYSDRERPVEESVVRRMCSAIRHRGPDDEGIFVSGGVGLGMRRLSIIDLSGGRQPIFNEDESKVIVFNGEIYNYRELRDELLARGHQLRTAGDTETVLHLFEDEGAACAARLRGMFAYAIWDRTSETLVLTRDRFGIKPLYVVSGDWGIAFASELKALHAAELTSRELDWEALDAYLQLGYVPAPLTPFRDVKKLEPGHHLTWRREVAPRTTRYWQFPLHEVQPDAHQEARVREWLDETVTAHMVSDVPVAAFLSGGLDSSAVVTSMAQHGDAAAPPHVFTARYSGSGSAATDETDLARSLANKVGARMTVVDISPNVRDIVERIVRALDEPHADDSAMPTWRLSQAVGSRYKVALTGIGGDELFAGYRRHIGLLAAQQYAKLPAGVRRLAGWASRLLPEPRSGGLGTDRLKRFLHGGAGSVPDRFLGLMSPIANGERMGLYTDDVRPQVSGESARRRFHEVFAAGSSSPSGLGGRPLSRLHDVPARRRARAQRSPVDGAFARGPRPLCRSRAGGSRISAAAAREDRSVVTAETAVAPSFGAATH